MNLNPVGWASSSVRVVARLFNSTGNSAVPVIAIRAEDASSRQAPAGYNDADVALVAKGNGATLAQVPDGTTVGGDKRGDYATDLQKKRSSVSQVASGSYAVVGGGNGNNASGINATIAGGANNTVIGNYATTGGGYNNSPGGVYATVGGGSSNIGSGNYTFVGGGSSNSAGSSYVTVCGGSNNQASGSYSFVGGGQFNIISSDRASIVGGLFNAANGSYSFVSGGVNGNTRNITGYHVFPACNSPIINLSGVTQSALLLLGRETTDATATVLTSNSSAATTTNQVILPNNSAYSFSGEVIAGVTGGGDTAAWNFKGAIKRGATAASTAIVGTVILDRIAYNTGAAGWIVAVTADTTNGGIAVTVTGAAATTIRWVCTINTTEMTY
jgi:hypothetical protein